MGSLNLFLVFISTVVALQCQKDRKLKKYDLEKTIHIERSMNTPPSTTIERWYFNLCESSDELLEGCEEDDIICGQRWIKLPTEEPILAHSIHLKNEDFEDSYGHPGVLDIGFKNVKWGDSDISPYVSFLCDLDLEEDEIEHLTWGQWISLQLIGPSGCVKPKYDRGHDNDRYSFGHEFDESWSWSTWILLALASVGTLYYIVPFILRRKDKPYTGLFEDIGEANEGFTQFIKYLSSKIRR